MKKRLLLITLMMLFTVSFGKIEIPSPTSKFFVNDFANVISESDEKEIFNTAKSLYESSRNSTQVVVVTVNSLEGYSIEEYANELFNTWGIGSKEKNDGVLLLLSVGDRKSRIEVGYGLEGILTDSRTGRIQDDYMIPYYKNNNFSKGLVSGTKAICNVINGDLVIENSISDNFGDSDKKYNHDSFETLFFLVSIVIMILSILVYSILDKFRLWIISIILVLVSGAIVLIGYALSSSNLIVPICFIICLAGISFFSDGSGGSSGGHSGGGFSGGGGHSGGGGSSRSF